MFSLVLLFVFSRETWNVMAWDGLVQPTGKYRSIRHMEYPKFRTSFFGRNGKRPSDESKMTSAPHTARGAQFPPKPSLKIKSLKSEALDVAHD